MKTTSFFKSITLIVCCFNFLCVFSQNTQKYSGSWFADEDYFYYINSDKKWQPMYSNGQQVSGHYNYYVKNDERIKHGAFRISYKLYDVMKANGMASYYDMTHLKGVEERVIIGQYANGKRNGTWTIYPNYFVANSSKHVFSCIKIPYVNGKIDGVVTITNTDSDKTPATLNDKLTFTIKDGKLTGNFIYQSNENYGQTADGETNKYYAQMDREQYFSGVNYSGKFDADGQMSGVWKFKYKRNDIPYSVDLEYFKGILLSVELVEQSSGRKTTDNIIQQMKDKGQDISISSITELKNKLQSTKPVAFDYEQYITPQVRDAYASEGKDAKMVLQEEFGTALYEWGGLHWVDLRDTTWEKLEDTDTDFYVKSLASLQLSKISYYVGEPIQYNSIVYMPAEETYRNLVRTLKVFQEDAVNFLKEKAYEDSLYNAYNQKFTQQLFDYKERFDSLNYQATQCEKHIAQIQQNITQYNQDIEQNTQQIKTLYTNGSKQAQFMMSIYYQLMPQVYSVGYIAYPENQLTKDKQKAVSIQQSIPDCNTLHFQNLKDTAQVFQTFLDYEQQLSNSYRVLAEINKSTKENEDSAYHKLTQAIDFQKKVISMKINIKKHYQKLKKCKTYMECRNYIDNLPSM